MKPPMLEHRVLHCECNILHHNDLLTENLDRGVIGTYFPKQDFHRIYFGEIVACYGDPDFLQNV